MTMKTPQLKHMAQGFHDHWGVREFTERLHAGQPTINKHINTDPDYQSTKTKFDQSYSQNPSE